MPADHSLDAALAAARDLVDRDFPAYSAALLAGSVVRGEATATSDLDLILLTRAGKAPAPFRRSLHHGDWPVEIFAHSPASFERFTTAEAARRRPSLAQMCAEGIVLRDHDGLAAAIQADARRQLAAGPVPLTPAEIATARYALTDTLDDFLGSERPAETFFLAHDLAHDAVDLHLALHRHWTGRGKWVPRALRRADPARADQLAAALAAFTATGDRAPLAAFARAVLDAAGGPLFAGYTGDEP
ncbi:MAG TPA: nucleotidyltransferase domain-containing protein [Ktedonobacterales bacterium]|jgi:hypothetical protein